MTESKKRKSYTGEFKARVAMEAIRGLKPANQIAQDFGVHPLMVAHWKKELLQNAPNLFKGTSENCELLRCRANLMLAARGKCVCA